MAKWEQTTGMNVKKVHVSDNKSLALKSLCSLVSLRLHCMKKWLYILQYIHCKHSIFCMLYATRDIESSRPNEMYRTVTGC